VTERLGVSHHFSDVFDVAAADYLPKPDPRPYGKLVDRHGVDPRSAVMVEDIARNLRPAADLGMTTVWIRTDSHWGQEDADGDHIHHVADDLVDWLNDLTGATG
jgi:putative hydrolase of the HAD superfamily